jgi:DNA-binding CsgD family transcriptional regulator
MAAFALARDMTLSENGELAERRAAILGLLPLGVILLDTRGVVVEANSAAYHLFGLTETSRTLLQLGRRVAEPLTGAPIPTNLLPWQRALAGESVREHDLAVAIQEPEARWHLVTVSARPFHDPVTQTSGALVVAFDRTRLVRRTGRELDLPPYLQRVLALLCQGQSTAEIASELHLTIGTTRLYVKRLYARMGVRSRAQLVLRAMELRDEGGH